MKKEFTSEKGRAFRRDDARPSNFDKDRRQSSPRKNSFNPNFDENNRFIGGPRSERPSRDGGYNRESGFNRDSRQGREGEFSKERSFERSEHPARFNREERSERPRFDRDSRSGRESGFNRDSRPNREGGFSRDNKFDRGDRREGGFNRERNFDRSDRPARFNREEGSSREGRFNREERSERPRFERDSRPGRESGFGKDVRPSREGGFSREGRPNREGGFSRDSRPSREGGFNRENKFDRNDRREGGLGRDSRSGRENRFGREERSDRPRFERTERPRFDREGRPGRNERPSRNRIRENYPRFEAKVSGDVRLNRYVANSGVCSRREADDLITAGLVSVNGEIVTELGTKVKPTDVIRFNDEVIKGEKNVYILMNKPKGYVTTIDDPHADKTVMDLLRDACTERIYPVGRLDKNTMGVLLFTNDGELTKKLTHPSYNKAKIYQVSLDRSITQADMQKLESGIVLEDGEIAADEVNFVGETRKEVGIEIHSGRNRIVRRMFDAVGYNVEKLDRVYFAGLTKKNLKRGAWRFLTPQEVILLKNGQYR